MTRRLHATSITLRTAKSKSWEFFCESVKDVNATSKLYRLLSKDPVDHLALLHTTTEDGQIVTNPNKRIENLLKTHFPGSRIVPPDFANPDTREINVEGHSRIMANRIVSEEKVRWAFSSFKPFKAAGTDGIQPVHIKEGISHLVGPLTKVYIASLELGHVPIPWRKAKVTFIPKPGKPNYNEAKMFRPISLTSFLLKGLERLVERHIRDTSLTESTLCRAQHAYQTGSGTETALHDLTVRIERAISRKQYAMGCFLDIQGAFDNVKTNAIVAALNKKEVDPIIVRWIAQMLRTRTVTTKMGDTEVVAAIEKGCPQGGVLSPLCWLLVVDSLLAELNAQHLFTQGYADDLVILIEGFNLETISGIMQRALHCVQKWCTDNGLAVNPKKTELILFTKRRNTPDQTNIQLNGTVLHFADKTKYLGVILDRKLNFREHVKTKCEKAVSCLMHCKRIASQRCTQNDEVYI